MLLLCFAGPATKPADAPLFTADEKMTGQCMRVSGVVAKIIKDKTGRPCVVLTTDKRDKYGGGQIECVFAPGQSSRVAGLKQFRNVVIGGTCRGMISTTVIDRGSEIEVRGVYFADCELIDNGIGKH